MTICSYFHFLWIVTSISIRTDGPANRSTQQRLKIVFPINDALALRLATTPKRDRLHEAYKGSTNINGFMVFRDHFGVSLSISFLFWHCISFPALQTNSHDFLSIRRCNCCYQIAYITHKLQFNIDNYEIISIWYRNINRFHYAKFSRVETLELVRWNRLNKLVQIVNDFSHVR